jgi:protease I
MAGPFLGYTARVLNLELTHIRVAVLVMDGVEEAEITQPLAALRATGAQVNVISQRTGTVQAFMHHTPSVRIPIDTTFDDVAPDEYDALLLPGGALNADALRVLPAAQAFAASFDNADKPIAAICHAPWLLISADLLAGRTLTSFHTIHDDIENAGGIWVDEAVVSDGNLVTSRRPDDLAEFNARMIALFATARPLRVEALS